MDEIIWANIYMYMGMLAQKFICHHFTSLNRAAFETKCTDWFSDPLRGLAIMLRKMGSCSPPVSTTKQGFDEYTPVN